MKTMLAISIGAILGANLRYGVGLWSQQFTALPIGTFLINTIGSFGLALFLSLVASRLPLSEEWRLLVATGFFGSFTTFSTFSVEVVTLAQTGQPGRAMFYAVASLIAGVGAAILGGWLLQPGR